MAQLSNKGIRILYIHGVAQIGGAERELLTWLKFLDRKRFHPYVVCPINGPLPSELDKLEIPHVSFSLPAWRKWSHLFWRPFAILQLIRIIQRWQIDVLHINDYWWAPLGILAGRATSRPCLVHVRQEIEPRKISQYWLNKRNLIVPVSESIANVIRNAGVARENIQVLLSGIAPKEERTSLPSPKTLETLTRVEGQPVIGTVANLFPRKGIEYLVGALRFLKKAFPSIALVIVGTGDDQYECLLKIQVEQFNLTENVFFVGFQEQPEFFISQFDVFVLPSVLEGFGVVLLEAMALGKPIVASHIGGIPEIVEHEKTGLLVKPADEKELYQALFMLLNDSPRRSKMGTEAKKRVEEQFSLNGMLEGLYGLYSNVLVRGT